MITLLIVFAAIVLAGLGFWFYNKRQVTSLAEQIDDKNLVISALRNHVESPTTVETTVETTIEKTVNLTPTVSEALSGNNQPKKNKNGGNKNNNKKKKSNTPIPFNPAESEIIVDLRQEKKNRPRPRKKNKPQQ